MLNSVLPMELWERYGITAYNIANPTEALPSSYWVLKNALDYKKPKIVIVEMFFAGDEKVTNEKEEFLHNFFDELPLSINKIAAIKDLLPLESMPEYLFPFVLYHDRWKEISKTDFVEAKNLNKGAEELKGHYISGEMCYTSEMGTPFATSEEYLNKIVDLCDKNEIELILMCAPYAATVEEQIRHNAYYKFANDNDVEYLNMIGKNIVDYDIDLSNRGHLNGSGALKVTDYLGDYLVNTYGAGYFSHSKEESEHWDEARADYESQMDKKIQAETDIYNCLIMLQNPVYECEITLNNGSICLQNCYLTKMIQAVYMAENSVNYVDECDYDISINIRKRRNSCTQRI